MTQRFSSLIGLLLLATSSLFAQVELRWDAHGIGFAVPGNFKVEANDADEFAATNGDQYLHITPIQDENITDEHLAEALIAMAEGLEYDALTQAAAADLHDFTGYFVLGKKDGVNALLMAMMDTKSSTNFLVVLVFADHSVQEAQAVANSFFAYD
jgi:hypothetical protein